MKLDFLSNLSERRQVAAVIVLGAVLIGALTYFLLLPQIRERRRIAASIDAMRSELQQKNYWIGEPALEDEFAAIGNHAADLRKEWDETVKRLSTFREIDLLDRAITLSEYQTARIEVSDRLEGIGRSRNIAVPPGLGLKPTVNSFEDVRARAHQLLAVEKLVGTLLDLGVHAIERVTVLRPVQHMMPETTTPFIEEYPVSIAFISSLDAFYDLCNRVLADKQVFSLRNIRMEKAGEDQPDKLRINAVMSALVFMGDVDQGLPAGQEIERPRRPLGF